MDALRTYKNDQGETLRIYQDTDPTDPRENDNIGQMVCFHNRYTLGDKHNYSDLAEWAENFAEELGYKWPDPTDDQEVPEPDTEELLAYIFEHAIVLPLYLYDHSGLAMSTSATRFRAVDSVGWDWGQVGVICCTHEKVRAEYGDDPDAMQKAEKYLIGEVQEYSSYLEGDCYGYTVTKETICDECGHVDEEEIDSCWGFIGWEYMEEEIKNLGSGDWDEE